MSETRVSLARLRAVAEKATPGVRVARKSTVSTVADGHWLAGTRMADAPHIAAFDRDTCLALVEIALAAQGVWVSRVLSDPAKIKEAWDALRTALAKVKE